MDTSLADSLDLDFFRKKPQNIQERVTVDIPRLKAALNIYTTSVIKSTRRNIERFEKYPDGQDRVEQERILLAQAKKWRNKDAFDRLLTSLKTIEGLEKIWGEEHPNVPFTIAFNKPYLMLQTEPVILNDIRDNTQWDMGNYLIMLPLGGELSEMHWVPMRSPTTPERHPHHGIRGQGVNTCLGTYGSYVGQALRWGDVLTLCQCMIGYIRSFDPYSVLYRVERIPFARHLKPQA